MILRSSVTVKEGYCRISLTKGLQARLPGKWRWKGI